MDIERLAARLWLIVVAGLALFVAACNSGGSGGGNGGY
jgi:hypothetical protein